MALPTNTTQRLPVTGDYRNDCPFCRTHNAILVKAFGTPTVYECRDCHREYTQDKDGKEWIYTNPKLD